MGKTVFRVLLVIFLVCFPLQAVVDVLVAASRPSAHSADLSIKLAVLALLLDPVSAIGLWCERRWGAVILVLSTVLVALTPLWVMAFWNLGILGIAGWRFIQIRKERRAAPDHKAAPSPTIAD